MPSPLLAVDTSVAVPLLVASHEAHRAVRSWAQDKVLHLGGHALAETYAVLTRLPGDARVAAKDAQALLDDNFAGMLTLSPELAVSVHRKFADTGVLGGAVYDGLVALAAQENNAVLATRDARAKATYDVLGVRTELVSEV
ncbi:PIN domain-containing protein [Nesterenkonia ebinurensis]|uniref:PIN domain-containing protein n=1 Tax=Nesterenkonia ebinurensis TaxID=2608252 RepID=UPI00123E3C9D|nr:PIN domain-containing protein [Nesterenkonia ebinurensis]